MLKAKLKFKNLSALKYSRDVDITVPYEQTKGNGLTRDLLLTGVYCERTSFGERLVEHHKLESVTTIGTRKNARPKTTWEYVITRYTNNPEYDEATYVTGNSAFKTLDIYAKYIKLDPCQKIGDRYIYARFYDFEKHKFRCYQKPYLFTIGADATLKFEHVWAYDINSSFANAFRTCVLPDTKALPRLSSTVKEGEIGFIYFHDGLSGQLLPTTYIGQYADWVFPILTNNELLEKINGWTTDYYNLKKSTDAADKARAKKVMNFAIGYISRINPFVHACILSKARANVQKYQDANVLLINTDSIIRIGEDKRIPVGDNLGEFKIEAEDATLYLKGFNYKVGKKVAIRGVSTKKEREEYFNEKI